MAATAQPRNKYMAAKQVSPFKMLPKLSLLIVGSFGAWKVSVRDIALEKGDLELSGNGKCTAYIDK